MRGHDQLPYVVVTGAAGRYSIDSNDWSPSSIGGANNEDRYFTDYGGNPQCFATGSSTERCYDAGASTGHAIDHEPVDLGARGAGDQRRDHPVPAG